MYTRNIFFLAYNPDLQISALHEVLSDWQVNPVNLHTLHSLNLPHSEACIGLFALDWPLSDEKFKKMQRVIQHNPHILWIGLINSESLDTAAIRSLIAESAVDYHSYPLDRSRLNHSIGHAHGMAKLLNANGSVHYRIENNMGLIGSSETINKIRKLIEKLAATDASVLITGESGTGKELAARELHQKSNRRNKPFVVINCGALPESLIQSELFGHEKGAFTNANRRHIGKIEAADGGTLFLDEIGDLPMSQQANLLRFLQDGIIERVGGRNSISVNARVIAATNIDLLQAIEQQLFRDDLFYRINVINIDMPPLRERDSDSVILAEFFLVNIAANRPGKITFSKQALTAINRYHWPGNIRELRNRIFRATAITETSVLSEKDLGLDKFADNRPPLTLATARENADISVIKQSLMYSQNNISQASKLLQVSRPTLYHLIAKYNLQNDKEESIQGESLA